MKKGVIFDMDGTLWDAVSGITASWNAAIRKAGYARAPLTEEEMYRMMGKTMMQIADLLFPELDEPGKRDLLAKCFAEENDYLRAHGGTPYPELRGTMERLRQQYPLYIVSNCQAGYIEAFLDFYRLWDLIEDIECYGNNEKPKAENIALICKRNALADAVYVGDIQADYDASRTAGVQFIHAAYGFGTIREPVPKVDCFAELPERINEVLK
jgi:phosphoglycolate phosphatase